MPPGHRHRLTAPGDAFVAPTRDIAATRFAPELLATTPVVHRTPRSHGQPSSRSTGTAGRGPGKLSHRQASTIGRHPLRRHGRGGGSTVRAGHESRTAGATASTSPSSAFQRPRTWSRSGLRLGPHPFPEDTSLCASRAAAGARGRPSQSNRALPTRQQRRWRQRPWAGAYSAAASADAFAALRTAFFRASWRACSSTGTTTSGRSRPNLLA